MPSVLERGHTTVAAPAPCGNELEAGVIEEARARQRRRRTLAAVTAAVAVVLGLVAVLIGGGGTQGNRGAAHGGPLKLAFVHGRPYVNGRPFLVGVTPSLEAGNVGLCIMQGSGGSCGDPYPSAGNPLFGIGGFYPEDRVSAAGEVDFTLTGPGVAAVRISGIGTVNAVALPGLPPGDRAVVFYRKPGSVGTVLPPGESPAIFYRFARGPHPVAVTLTPLDGAGREMPIDPTIRMFQLPNAYWRGPAAPPSNGRCRIASQLRGAAVQWGQVATTIVPDASIPGPAFLSCIQVWYTLHNTALQAAVLLNAQSPRSPPADLWGATPVPGHPGIVQIKATQSVAHYFLPRLSAQQLKRFPTRQRKQIARIAGKEHTQVVTLTVAAVARRVGNAWLLVRYGNTLTRRINFLNTLRIARLDVTAKTPK